ncbi:hypothetical protein BDY21DRAFT_369688 [Lineolata rhizophorae]|uniref:Uncharacterized protein n=1 Tax=Lineolata rhizophorae TaxID=578093 RepID=A0A6A6P7D2_9PEZI|nr:hypothetical protein BDY21DRAFT_369688 [Lineolata rhizophorae]
MMMAARTTDFGGAEYPPAQQQHHQHEPHGVKRRAEDSSVGDSQRLAKRFNLLNLGLSADSSSFSIHVDPNGKKLYIPVASSPSQTAGTSTTTSTPASPPTNPPTAAAVIPTTSPSSRPPAPARQDSDYMQLDDTSHKVYIYDLDAELASSDSDSDRPVFLSDIERHLLNKVPRHVLIGDELRATAANQLVLYGVPSSLTVPEDRDSVRKAIIEARHRAREKGKTELPDEKMVDEDAMEDDGARDADAMEIE